MSDIQHGLECPDCHEHIYSNSRHDYVECRCKRLYIDGGFDYKRWGGENAATAVAVSRNINPPRIPPFFRQEEKHA